MEYTEESIGEQHQSSNSAEHCRRSCRRGSCWIAINLFGFRELDDRESYYAEWYLQAPNITHPSPDVIVIHFARTSFNFKTLFICEVQQTDETETGADFFHLISWI